MHLRAGHQWSGWASATTLALLVVLGVAVATQPWIALIATAGMLGLSLAIIFASDMPGVALALLGALLMGYAFAGRGFAYVGFPPIFVGEAVLLVGLLAASLTRGVRDALRLPLFRIWLLFAVWGAARTIPYVGRYGFDALRDAAMWAYGAFAILVVVFLRRTGKLLQVPEYYGRCITWFLVWTPALALIASAAEDSLPRMPGSDSTIPSFKPGDMAVHLAGIAAFLLVGLHEASGSHTKKNRTSRFEAIWWVFWLVGACIVASVNRAGALAILVAMSTVLILRPSKAIGKVVLVGLLALMLLLASSAQLFDLPFQQQGRDMAADQIVSNLTSIVSGGSNEEQLESSKRWRLTWWGNIIDYTVHGEYFWSGKGFGVNLADDDGFQTDGSLRSPHSGHMNILARMGVPGLVLWVAMQGAFAFGLVRAYLRSRRDGREWWARVNLWILAYWAAFMVNIGFDVYLEGPQGGIWFWALFGLGVAALREQSGRQPAAAERHWRP